MIFFFVRKNTHSHLVKTWFGACWVFNNPHQRACWPDTLTPPCSATQGGVGSWRATGAGGSRAARYINLINTNTQSRRALFNNGDNPPPFNSRSRSKITECRILSGWVKQSHGGGGAEGLKYTFRERIYPKLLLLKGAMTKQMCVPGWASQLHQQLGRSEFFAPSVGTSTGVMRLPSVPDPARHDGQNMF